MLFSSRTSLAVLQQTSETVPVNGPTRELVSSPAHHRRLNTVRYPDGESPDARYPEGELMSEMLTFSMYLSIVIGIVLLVIGWRGRSIWLSFWSVGLILCSVVYLVGNAMGWFYA